MSAIQSEPANLDGAAIELTAELMRKRRSQLRIIFDRFIRNKVAVAGLVMLLIITLMAIFAPIITHQTATYDPANDPNLNIMQQGPSAAHPLGTDDLGRDELARLLFGARVSMLVGITSMLMALGIGVAVGSLAGYYGGWIDNILMRVTDAFLAVPVYLILFVLSASFNNGTVLSVVILIATFSWAITARIVRGEFLALKEREYLLAARTLGASDLRLMLRHILPNAAGPIIVSATLLVGGNIILESVLSFFNFGLQPPQASWGTMLNASESFITTDPLLVWLPGLAILLTVLSFNLIGDGLRDALDPYMTER